MSILKRVLNIFKKKPLTEEKVFGDIAAQTFKLKDLHKIITTCPDGSRILINNRVWIQVFHNEVSE